MREIVLAGGLEIGLAPLTKVASKRFLPFYDKSPIYYPLSILMFTDVIETFLIEAPNQSERFKGRK
jgi:dTDP-glucose pyrophosphorylase